MNQPIECPVDGVPVNENKVRVIAFFVLLIGTSYLITAYWPLLIVLLIDFALRAFNYARLSPLAGLSGVLVTAARLPVRLTDQAPKRFAAGVGLVFVLAILTLHLLAVETRLLTSILLVFAALESLVGFCAGCYVYAFLKRMNLISTI